MNQMNTKGLQAKSFVFFSVTYFKAYLSPEVVIELLAQLCIVSELQENIAKCTTSTSIAAVNSKHERVHVEYRMQITIRRNPLT